MPDTQIIVTGAAGFIGSCMVGYLNQHDYHNLILVDDFGVEAKRPNWEGKAYAHIVERYNLFDWLKEHDIKPDIVIHLGARTDTTEFDYSIHEKLNVQYSINMWHYCTEQNIPLIYASSAATYGAGEKGYNDVHGLVYDLHPLNPYGVSKNEFDKWALDQKEQPPFWAGLKFFNVYGPNEYHKGRMASVIWHSYKQIKENGVVKLFRSHRDDFKDGEQLRDFIYVKDVLKTICWMMSELATSTNAADASGLYNLGTGKARSFNHLAEATFHAMGLKPVIQYIDMPEDIRDKYQYFTEAQMDKLRNIGYQQTFCSLEDGVTDYVKNYILSGRYY